VCVMAERDIDPVADILVAIVFQGKKDYVKNTTHNMQRHVTGYLQSTPGKLHLPKQACLIKGPKHPKTYTKLVLVCTYYSYLYANGQLLELL